MSCYFQIHPPDKLSAAAVPRLPLCSHINCEPPETRKGTLSGYAQTTQSRNTLSAVSYFRALFRILPPKAGEKRPNPQHEQLRKTAPPGLVTPFLQKRPVLETVWASPFRSLFCFLRLATGQKGRCSGRQLAGPF